VIAMNCSLEETCAQFIIAFFKKHPNRELRKRAGLAPVALMKRKKVFPGRPEGWAAEIVFAVDSVGCGVPNVPNSEWRRSYRRW
jgi:hypothetical protein